MKCSLCTIMSGSLIFGFTEIFFWGHTMIKNMLCYRLLGPPNIVLECHRIPGPIQITDRFPYLLATNSWRLHSDIWQGRPNSWSSQYVPLLNVGSCLNEWAIISFKMNYTHTNLMSSRVRQWFNNNAPCLEKVHVFDYFRLPENALRSPRDII